MNPEQEKLLDLLSSMDSYAVDKMVDMSYAMRVKHPRPRAGMNRFVLCGTAVEGAVAQLLDKQNMRIRLAVPATQNRAELAANSRLEIYSEDKSLFCILTLTQLSDSLTSSIHAELVEEVTSLMEKKPAALPA